MSKPRKSTLRGKDQKIELPLGSGKDWPKDTRTLPKPPKNLSAAQLKVLNKILQNAEYDQVYYINSLVKKSGLKRQLILQVLAKLQASNFQVVRDGERKLAFVRRRTPFVMPIKTPKFYQGKDKVHPPYNENGHQEG